MKKVMYIFCTGVEFLTMLGGSFLGAACGVAVAEKLIMFLNNPEGKK